METKCDGASADEPVSGLGWFMGVSALDVADLDLDGADSSLFEGTSCWGKGPYVSRILFFTFLVIRSVATTPNGSKRLVSIKREKGGK